MRFPELRAMMQGQTLTKVGAAQQQVNKSVVGSARSDADSKL
jgi:hypothetical protein